jgi:hypothetical protein
MAAAVTFSAENQRMVSTGWSATSSARTRARRYFLSGRRKIGSTKVLRPVGAEIGDTLGWVFVAHGGRAQSLETLTQRVIVP